MIRHDHAQVEVVQRAATRMTRLVEDLLDVTRIETEAWCSISRPSRVGAAT